MLCLRHRVCTVKTLLAMDCCTAQSYCMECMGLLLTGGSALIQHLMVHLIAVCCIYSSEKYYVVTSVLCYSHLNQSINTQDQLCQRPTNPGHEHKAPDHNLEATQPKAQSSSGISSSAESLPPGDFLNSFLAAPPLSATCTRIDGIYGCHYTAGNILWKMWLGADPETAAQHKLAAKNRAKSMQHFRDFVNKAPLEHPQVGGGRAGRAGGGGVT